VVEQVFLVFGAGDKEFPVLQRFCQLSRTPIVCANDQLILVILALFSLNQLSVQDFAHSTIFKICILPIYFFQW